MRIEVLGPLLMLLFHATNGPYSNCSQSLKENLSHHKWFKWHKGRGKGRNAITRITSLWRIAGGYMNSHQHAAAFQQCGKLGASLHRDPIFRRDWKLQSSPTYNLLSQNRKQVAITTSAPLHSLGTLCLLAPGSPHHWETTARWGDFRKSMHSSKKIQ